MGDKRKILGSMNVDYSKFDEKDSQGNYLFGCPDVLSTRSKCVYLPEWKGEYIKSVDEKLTIFTDVTIKCKGEECPFSDVCPLVKHKLVSRWIGSSCAVEIVDAFRLFAGYINDLEIDPENFSDIQMINDLVRLHIQMSRCDKLIRKENPVEVMVTGVDSKTGLKHEARQPNQLIALQRQFRQDIGKKYDDLVASRRGKIEAQAKQMRKEDVSNQMADLLAAASKLGNFPDEEDPTATRMSNLELS